jgi:hypothetical protein
MLRPRRTVRWHPAGLVLTCALLAACASRPQRSGRRDLRLVDTETSARVRHAAAITEGASSLAPTAAVASTLAQVAPILLTLLEDDNAVGEFE